MNKRNKQSQAKKITHPQMADAIRRSGYLMEQRLFPVIENAGFYVETNPVYLDPLSGKSREYDFSAITGVKLYREDFDFLFTFLIGECLNNPQPIVFFTSKSPIDFLFHENIKCAGIPAHFPDDLGGEDEISLQDFFHLDKFHHYCHGTYSTQYCSFKQKSGKDEWLAWHDDEHQGLFNTLIEATKYEVRGIFSDWMPPSKDEEEPVNITLFYPVLVIHRDLFECTQRSGKPFLKKRNHIQFRKAVISGKHQETYQVDVIVESYLKQYLDIILKEQEQLKARFQRKKKIVRIAVDRIVSKAKAANRRNRMKDFRAILEL